MSRADLLTCTEDQKLAILKSYGKTPETVAEDIGKLKEWLEKQPHLPKDVADDRLLEGFLILNKFRMQQTKQKLDFYYTARSLMPELRKTPTDPDVLNLVDIFYMVALPKLSRDLDRVTLIKVKEHVPDIDEYEAMSTLIHGLHMSEVRLREDYFLSQIAIVDLEGVKFKYFVRFTPTILKKSVFILEKLFSGRVRAIHYVNLPPFANSFVSLAKSFSKPKLANRIHIHKDYESLYKVVQKDIMPKELGGEERSLEELHEAWKQKVLEYQGTLEKLLDVKVNEALRQEEFPYPNDYFGLEGNFRKLDFD